MLKQHDVDEITEFEDYFVRQIQQNQRGHGIPVFKQFRYQKGGIVPNLPTALLLYCLANKNRNQHGDGFGSFFKGLFRALLPVAKQGLKSLGKQAVETGVDIVRDISLGHDWKESSKHRLDEAGERIVDKTKKKVDKIMSGAGRKRGNLRNKSKKINKKDAFSKKLLSLIGPPKKTHQKKTNHQQQQNRWI